MAAKKRGEESMWKREADLHAARTEVIVMKRIVIVVRTER